MDTMSLVGPRRIGAIAGLAAVGLLIAIVTMTPAAPAPDRSIETVAAAVAAHGDGMLVGAYLGGLMTTALLVFGAVVVSVLRARERGGAWWILALAGIAASSIALIADALQVAWVHSAEHGATGGALWALYSAPHAITVFAVLPIAVFLLGAGLSARATGALPRWTTWVALAGAATLVIGAGSSTGNELTGGPLAIPLLLGLVGFGVWVVAVSVALSRGAGRHAASRAPVALSD